MSKKKPNRNLPQPLPHDPLEDTETPLVAIGASAGGLEAFERFFRTFPPESGIGFVLIPHLDPTHASIMTELLQKATPMTVVEAEDEMMVEANHVYVIPPNREMGIFHGALQLDVPESPRGQRMPIDFFLRSLAEDRGEKAIGIILSGTGTDGTLGLRAIQGAGGITIAQDPADAKYNGMPASAIQGGFATYVLPVEAMAARLISSCRALSFRRPPLPDASPDRPDSDLRQEHRKILTLLRSITGHDFSLYKQSTIRRRIERRMTVNGIDDVSVYGRYIKEHTSEADILFKELLINVTNFFRDPEAFDVLKNEIAPLLLKGKPEGYVLRVWVPACATGEEAYSIAIVLRELIDDRHLDIKVQIYATDLDEDAIARARSGIYPPNIVADVSAERLRRFFIQEDASFRVKKGIREMVVFAIQNVLEDPPFTKLDLLSCRNLMIYLGQELQARLIPTFHYALRPGGVLFLSPSESIGNHTDLFTPINRRWKFYGGVKSGSSRSLLTGAVARGESTVILPPRDTSVKTRESSLAELTRRTLLQSFAPASVVADARGNIVYVHGDTGRFLRPAPGNASLNVVEMAREGLQQPLRSALREAGEKGSTVYLKGLNVKTNGDFESVDLSVRPLADESAPAGFLVISFQGNPDPPDRKKTRGSKKQTQRQSNKTGLPGQVEQLERELASVRDNYQATTEEQQATNEELRSANEELQSTNEELQSTNEEMETSKEELQSVNEELVTVNAELQSKIEQLTNVQNDMKNFVDSINIGIIFLDSHLTIRRFTREATRIFRLVGTDVDRSLADIKSSIVGEGDIMLEIQQVLDTLVPEEREIQTSDREWHLMRILPYRTLENMIDGVVLTFTDITARRQAEMAGLSARKMAENIVRSIRDPLVVLDSHFAITTANPSFLERFAKTQDVPIGLSLFDLNHGGWNRPALRFALSELLEQGQGLKQLQIDYDLPGIGPRPVSLTAHLIEGREGPLPLILLIVESIGGPETNAEKGYE